MTAASWVPPVSAEDLYSRVQRFGKGQLVPDWIKHIEPADPRTTLVFARDCEVLYHGAHGCSLWPVAPFTRKEPRLFFEAKGLPDGHMIVGDCEFWMQMRS